VGRIVAPTPERIAEAAAVLLGGGLVGMPTETVYGLAARVGDPAAIARVFAAKDRPLFDPLIVHLADPDLSGVVDRAALGPAGREAVSRLAAIGWPGPLTLVLPRSAVIPDLAAAGLPTVAVRVPAHPVARALVVAAGPLVAPSANRFGRISPTTAAHVVEELGDRVDLVVDGGPCAVGVESTIVEVLPDGRGVLLRPGGLPIERIEAILGPLLADKGPVRAPGALPSHYAPSRPVVIGDFSQFGPGTAALAFDSARAAVARAHRLAPVELPSPEGDPAAIATGLFAALRRLDAAGPARIAVEPTPSRQGLWHAIADRLERASRHT
jgi:L-threonylcarbamoyladenylate synthase